MSSEQTGALSLEHDAIVAFIMTRYPAISKEFILSIVVFAKEIWVTLTDSKLQPLLEGEKYEDRKGRVFKTRIAA